MLAISCYKTIFSRCRSSFWATQYSVDAWALLQHLVRYCTYPHPEGRGDKVEGRLMIDRDHFRNRKSTHEVGCVRDMMMRGCQVKSYYPGGNGFASLHLKGWLLDEVVYVGGSMNMTMQSLDYNVEELVIITDAEICRQ